MCFDFTRPSSFSTSRVTTANQLPPSGLSDPRILFSQLDVHDVSIAFNMSHTSSRPSTSLPQRSSTFQPLPPACHSNLLAPEFSSPLLPILCCYSLLIQSVQNPSSVAPAWESHAPTLLTTPQQPHQPSSPFPSDSVELRTTGGGVRTSAR